MLIDKDGKLHRAIRSGNSGANALYQTEPEFAVPLEHLQAIEFQTRPFEWVEFANVRLTSLNLRDGSELFQRGIASHYGVLRERC